MRRLLQEINNRRIVHLLTLAIQAQSDADLSVEA